MTDLRNSLPAGVNNADMNASGERCVPIANYGNPSDPTILDRIFKAWGVAEEYLIHPVRPGVEPVPPITDVSGPSYMLRFADGKWRYAIFAGLQAPPWTYCSWESWEGPTGEAALLRMRLRNAVRAHKRLESLLLDRTMRVSELRQKLAEVMRAFDKEGR